MIGIGWIILIVWSGLAILAIMFARGSHIDDSEVPRA
jgi:hypothetical protein